MLCKPQHLEINCIFQSQFTVKPTLKCIKLSVTPLEKHDFYRNKHKDSNFLPLHEKGHKKDGKFHKKNVKQSDFGVGPHGFVEELGRKESGTERADPRNGDNVGGMREMGGGGLSFRGKTVHTRCSMKCAKMLQALESVSDLDEALRPWEGRIKKKEMRIILKEQVSWERGVAIFEWFNKECYELDVIHYNVMLRIVGKARKWGHVERLWDEMRSKGIKPINSTYGTLIDVYGKGGRMEEALVWLRRMDEQGLLPDEVTMGVVVQMYKKAGEFQKAEEFFQAWSKPQHRMKLYTYNMLIDTYGKAGKICEMRNTFKKMVRDGVVPDTVTFNSMIHSYGNVGMIEEVNALMKMMEECKRSPDARTFNILISLYAKRDDIDLAYSYFVKMKEICVERDTVSYRTLLNVFSVRQMVVEAERLVSEMLERGLEIDEYLQTCMTRMYIDADMLDKSWSWFERFHLEGNMSSECYSANIDAYGERGHLNEAEKVFLCCREKNKIGVFEFNVMIKAYCICKKYNKACQLFDGMGKQGIIPNRCTYITLVQSLAAADLPHIAKPYLLKMQKAGLVTDCVPYTALISSFTKLGQLDLAESLYREMIGYNVQPDVVLFGTLINASAERGNVAEATSYINALNKAGLSLNEVICNSLIKLYTKVGFLDKAKETYQLLQSFETGPNAYSSNCMIDLYSKCLMVREAEEIFNDMKRKGGASEFSFAMMLCMYKRIGRVEEAIKIAERMQELGLLAELLSYNNVLSLFATVGKFKEAVNLFNHMIQLEIEPDDYSFGSLRLVLVKSGVSKQAVARLDVARKKDSQNGVQAWMSALASVVSSDSYGDYDND